MRRVRSLFLGIACAVGSLASADIAFVTCQNGDELSVIDLETGHRRAWSVPGKPAGVAVSEDAVFTVSPDSKEVRRLSIRNGEVLASTVLDGGPIGVALDTARNRLFVSDWYNARIWVLQAETLETQGALVTGAAPAGLSLSQDGRFVASADRDADQVSIFAADSLALLHSVPVGIRPFGLSFAPDGRLFVGNVGSNDVSVIDPESGQVLATIPVGERPYGVAFAQGSAFVSNQYEDTVSVISMTTLRHTGKITVGEYPEGIDATSDGAHVVVANWFDNTISIIDAGTKTVIEEYQTGDGPRAFGAFLLGGGNTWENILD